MKKNQKNFGLLLAVVLLFTMCKTKTNESTQSASSETVTQDSITQSRVPRLTPFSFIIRIKKTTSTPTGLKSYVQINNGSPIELDNPTSIDKQIPVSADIDGSGTDSIITSMKFYTLKSPYNFPADTIPGVSERNDRTLAPTLAASNDYYDRVPIGGTVKWYRKKQSNPKNDLSIGIIIQNGIQIQIITWPPTK